MKNARKNSSLNRREVLLALGATAGGLAGWSGLHAAEHSGPRSSKTGHQPIVEELIALLKSRPDLAEALKKSIRKADRPDVRSFPQYCDFLNRMVTLIPTDRNLKSVLLKFYYLIDLSPKDALQSDASFQRWTLKFAEDWGAFLDTTESAKEIKGFFSNPSYHIEDYYVAPSGWLTFNQFFARQVRPGKRPIEARCDDSVVVSPADSVFQGHWPVQGDSKISVKGLTWSVIELLDGSPYQDRFRGGVFTHAFLNVNDYHRYHVPVGGVVKEVRKIPGRVTLDVIKNPDGTLDSVDGTGYQFTQDRGLIVIDSPLGMVAVLPIGMAQVSSVTLTARVGSVLSKGEEFGFFSFGGSDIVTLFEAGKVQLEAKVGTHYNQGTRIGRALNIR
jgi:phosphatidylserine decarboxylase